MVTTTVSPLHTPTRHTPSQRHSLCTQAYIPCILPSHQGRIHTGRCLQSPTGQEEERQERSAKTGAGGCCFVTFWGRRVCCATEPAGTECSENMTHAHTQTVYIIFILYYVFTIFTVSKNCDLSECTPSQYCASGVVTDRVNTLACMIRYSMDMDIREKIYELSVLNRSRGRRLRHERSKCMVAFI